MLWSQHELHTLEGKWNLEWTWVLRSVIVRRFFPIEFLDLSQHATRLVIIQGQYEYLSMAVFGDVIADVQKVRGCEPRPIPALNSVSIPKSVDPSNSTEPTMIAQQLISLLPDSPPLSLIVRLIFCLKPPNEDWEHPDFPYLYSDLDSEDEMYSIATLVQSISRPVKDDVSVDTLSTFAERIIDFLEPKVSFDSIEFLHSIQKLFNRVQMMPITSLSYSVFLHLNGRLSHGQFWSVLFSVSLQILLTHKIPAKIRPRIDL
jgi:hypothetical protein